ncbi:MAG: nitroreductase family protein [Candidatus Thorarchaeota archaeon]
MLLDVIKKRKSGRAYSEKPVPDDILHSIIEAGRKAPSCANTQAWNFVVIKDPDVRSRANEAMSRGNVWGERAPVMVLVAANPTGGCPAHELPYFMMDVGLAVENMLLQAVHVGLMGHPTAGWNEKQLKEITGIPEEYRIVTVVFFGYEFEGEPTFLSEKNQEHEKKRTPRKPLNEIVHWDNW